MCTNELSLLEATECGISACWSLAASSCGVFASRLIGYAGTRRSWGPDHGATLTFRHGADVRQARAFGISCRCASIRSDLVPSSAHTQRFRARISRKMTDIQTNERTVMDPRSAVEDAPAVVAQVDVPPMTQRRVLGLSLPIIGENLLQSAVGVIDTLMIARVGSAALAGVGVSLEIVFFMIAILSSVSIGGTVLISQAIGAGNRARANTLSRQTVLWGLVISLPLGILGYVLAPALIGLFHTEPDVEEHAITYLRITGAMVVTLLMTFVCGAVLRGAGDSRSPLIASLFANVVKIVL